MRFIDTNILLYCTRSALRRMKQTKSDWDCAILAAARLSSCEAVYSEDLSHTQNYDGLRVINPFAEMP